MENKKIINKSIDTTKSISDEKKVSKQESKSVIDRKILVDYAVQFGSQTHRWNPKMKKYIFGAKNNTHIINVTTTFNKLNEAYRKIYNITKDGGKVLFVGTSKIAKKVIKENAIRTNSYYISERWFGGTLTNFNTIKNSIQRLKNLERMAKNNFADFTKKEGVLMYKEMKKLQSALGGIKYMRTRPKAIIVAQSDENRIAINEANKLNIPVFAIVDTNCNPDGVDYVIPSNDDSSKPIGLICTVLADAIAQAMNEPTLVAHQSLEKAKVLGVIKNLNKNINRNFSRNSKPYRARDIKAGKSVDEYKKDQIKKNLNKEEKKKEKSE